MDEPTDRDADLIWDGPTRLFHWALPILVIAALLTDEFGSFDRSEHMLVGYMVLALLLFRLIWGFVGGRHARFGDFLRGPVAVARHARSLTRSDAPRHRGHNPLGGWSVVALLGCLSLQTITGLFAQDDILATGPLRGWIDDALSNRLTAIHHVNVKVLYALIGLHLAAIAFHELGKRHPLVGPMITGRSRNLPEGRAGAVPARGSWPRAALAMLASAAAVTAIVLVGRDPG